jgi:hypothetical protein
MIFLGGSCGATDWRQTIAIPMLRNAALEYFDPQVAVWTAEEHEARDMEAKARADVLIFVITGETRSVASLAEVAYLIAAGRPLALAVEDVAGASREAEDLNRGRLFVRSMAKLHGIPCFSSAREATAHAIELANRPPLTIEKLQEILGQIECGQLQFRALDEGGLQLVIGRDGMSGRRWPIDRQATAGEVVQTALKAVLTWEEHEARERFRWRGRSIFSPHQDLNALYARK